MEMNGKFIKFLELKTEDGPLYLYEIYLLNPDDNTHEVPTTREFFTQLEGIRNYHSLDFLNGDCRYPTQYYTMQGECLEDYTTELSPSEFLERVEPYLKNEELKIRKAGEVYLNMEYRAEQKENLDRRIKSNDLSIDQKNESAQKVLKKYIKIES